MALVKYGGGIIQMSGSVAGNTHARNRYGNYIRARTKPTNPNTALQVSIRAAIAYLVERWAETLTAAQRAAWNLYASSVTMKNKLGESIKLSGFNHYIRSNAIITMKGGSPTDDGPTVFELPAHDPTLSIAASEGTQLLNFSFDTGMAWATEAGAYLQCFQGTPQNAQRNFFGGPWRWIMGLPGVDPAGAASPAAITAIFAISEGQRQWVYCRIQRADGRLSETFRADCIVAA